MLITLEEGYGDSVNVSIVAFDRPSISFIEQMDDEFNFSAGYDVVLFEPLTLNNNGVVMAETQHEYIRMFIDRVKDEVRDAVVVLHPPQPSHRAVYYTNEVQSVKSFAEENNFQYIEH